MTGGEIGGEIEVLATSVRAFPKLFLKYFGKTSIRSDVERFTKNYEKLFAAVKKDAFDIDRCDMPVIDKRHVEMLYHHLINGKFNVNPPYDKELQNILNRSEKGVIVPDQKDVAGTERYRSLWEGCDKHDRVHASFDEKKAKRLIPIQKQVYLDKIFEKIRAVLAAHPDDFDANMERHLSHCTLVTSADKMIIDGHHRWGTTMLLDPSFKLKTLAIELPLNKLLLVSLAFTAKIGNNANH